MSFGYCHNVWGKISRLNWLSYSEHHRAFAANLLTVADTVEGAGGTHLTQERFCAHFICQFGTKFIMGVTKNCIIDQLYPLLKKIPQKVPHLPHLPLLKNILDPPL
jgi:hypothetical protein